MKYNPRKIVSIPVSLLPFLPFPMHCLSEIQHVRLVLDKKKFKVVRRDRMKKTNMNMLPGSSSGDAQKTWNRFFE